MPAATPKAAGASCPNCDSAFCAEYAQIGAQPRWSCSCGAFGPLTGSLSIRSTSAPPASENSEKPRTVHEHWSTRKAG